MADADTLTRPSLDTTQGSEACHHVHMDCQKNAAFAVSMCGLAMGWDEEAPDRAVDCVPCEVAECCPVCGEIT